MMMMMITMTMTTPVVFIAAVVVVMIVEEGRAGDSTRESWHESVAESLAEASRIAMGRIHVSVRFEGRGFGVFGENGVLAG